MNQDLHVAELSTKEIPFIVSYWCDANETHLSQMGVDPQKLPDRDALTAMLQKVVEADYKSKPSLAVIWFLKNKPIGHCNVTDIDFGKEAFMHLHMWSDENRGKGFGEQLLKLSIPHFFEKLDLKRLISEPYATNTAPSKTLPKVGFRFVKEYETIPGSLSFKQTVKRWVLELS